MNVKIGQVPPSKIDHVWSDVSDGISHVLDMFDNEMSVGEIYQNLISGSMWLIIATENNRLIGSFVCSYEEYAGRKVMFIHIVYGGPMASWRDPLIEFLKEGARKCGATEIESRGRKGIMRVFRDIATVKHVSMVIPVEEV